VQQPQFLRIENHPQWVCFCIGRLSCHPDARRTRKTPSLVYFRVRRLSFTPDARRTRKNTLVGVFSCSTPLLSPRCMANTETHPRWCIFVFDTFLFTPMHVEHEKTPSLVCFRVRRLSFTLDARRTRKHTNDGVFLSSAPFLHPGCMPNVETHPCWMCFRVRHLSCAAMHVEHENHLLGVVSVSNAFLSPPNACRTQKHTLAGVFL